MSGVRTSSGGRDIRRFRKPSASMRTQTPASRPAPLSFLLALLSVLSVLVLAV